MFVWLACRCSRPLLKIGSVRHTFSASFLSVVQPCLAAGGMQLASCRRMKKPALLIVLGALLLAPVSSVAAQRSAPPPPQDNTKVNKQGGTTADQQSQDKADLDLVKKIRQAIVKDKTLSTNAHNCKVITRDGTVTLRGPVKSAKEKADIGEIATKIAGAGKVTNVLTIAPPKK